LQGAIFEVGTGLGARIALVQGVADVEDVGCIRFEVVPLFGGKFAETFTEFDDGVSVAVEVGVEVSSADQEGAGVGAEEVVLGEANPSPSPFTGVGN